MTEQILQLEDVKDTPLQKIIDRVLNERTRFIIRISEDEFITIQSQPPLKPLPVFEGHVPDNWKEAIYKID